MSNYELVEYRPGRWAKIDVMTGMFLGPAGADEVRGWQHQPGDSPIQPGLHAAVKWRQAMNGRPTTSALEVLQSALGTIQSNPDPVGTMDAPAPQKPDGNGQAPEPKPKEKKSAPQKPRGGPKHPLVQQRRIGSSFRAHLMRRPPSTTPGIDLPCPRGTEVRAWAKGKVLRSRWSTGGGRCLWIQHAGGIKTYYAHLHATWVLEGEMVRAGQKIGETGSTGRSTGPHLHFSVVKGGKFMDPEPLIRT